jgi:hypothetical protein
MNVNDQIDYVCQKLAADPNLADGFNAVGFSQVTPPSRFLTLLREASFFVLMSNDATIHQFTISSH